MSPEQLHADLAAVGAWLRDMGTARTSIAVGLVQLDLAPLQRAVLPVIQKAHRCGCGLGCRWRHMAGCCGVAAAASGSTPSLAEGPHARWTAWVSVKENAATRPNIEFVRTFGAAPCCPHDVPATVPCSSLLTARLQISQQYTTTRC